MRKKTFLLILVLLLFVSGYFIYTSYSPTFVPYSTFIFDRDSKEIDEVTLYKDKIVYKIGGSSFRTDNPDSSTLKEELLLENINVKDEREDTLDSIINTLINIIFLALILFGLYKLIGYYTSTFKIVTHTGVHFSDIAGMSEEKEEILYAVKNLKTNGSIRNIKGIILEGPPGNGKTLFARALAEEAGTAFIATKGADFQGALMGLGAFKVKMLFSKARRNKPCIIFIDEFDSIGEKRNYAGSGIDKENNRIITTLLNEMDGFLPSSRILVIAATNSFDSLDSALIRPGRFDLKFTVPNPDEKTREELINLYLKGTPLIDGLTEKMLVSLFSNLSAAAIETVLNEAKIIRERKKLDGIDRETLLEAGRKTAQKFNIKK